MDWICPNTLLAHAMVAPQGAIKRSQGHSTRHVKAIDVKNNRKALLSAYYRLRTNNKALVQDPEVRWKHKCVEFMWRGLTSSSETRTTVLSSSRLANISCTYVLRVEREWLSCRTFILDPNHSYVNRQWRISTSHILALNGFNPVSPGNHPTLQQETSNFLEYSKTCYNSRWKVQVGQLSKFIDCRKISRAS
jgi:hypothetical protein